MNEVLACPCLCGCPAHIREVCLDCGCGKYAPDYVAGARQQGQEVSPEREKELRSWSNDLARQLGHTGRPRPGVTLDDNRIERRCVYCRGRYRVGRSHSRACSGACRQAMSAALLYESDDDVPGPYFRQVHHSRERAAATGFGMLSASEAVHADLRIRRAVRIAAIRAERTDHQGRDDAAELDCVGR